MSPDAGRVPLSPARAMVELPGRYLEMNHNLPALLVAVFFGCIGVAIGQTINDPARIDVYVTPYYDSKGPSIDVGPFSKGLGAASEPEFVGTIAKMKQS